MEQLVKHCLHVRHKTLGSMHPHTLASMNLLASTYKRQGNFVAAEPLYMQCLETQRLVLGPEHPVRFQRIRLVLRCAERSGRR